MTREKNMKIRVGMRVFLECNKGKKYTGKEICDFLNKVIDSKQWIITPKLVGKLFNTDRSNLSAILYPVHCEKTYKGHRVYWVE
ncbi:hypothetical protein [Methanobrevibacter sp.]|uniref:hypothetical protein n=1 Tax=Methanobrevibacter sp. TaxID=66852 RepID=UPI00386C2D21